MEALLSCPSHNVLPLAGACLCPLCHCGQVVSRTGLDLNRNDKLILNINLVLPLITMNLWRYQNCNLLRTIAIHQSVDEWYGSIDFHWKNTDFHHKIVACLNVGVRGEAWGEGVGLEGARQRTASHGHKRPRTAMPMPATNDHARPWMTTNVVRGHPWPCVVVRLLDRPAWGSKIGRWNAVTWHVGQTCWWRPASILYAI